MASANAYRPKLPEGINRFQGYTFPSQLFDLNRPHPAALAGTEPRKVTLTGDAVLMRTGADVSALYARATAPCQFPCEAPHYPADDIQASKPKFPSVQVPPQLHPKLVTQEGEDIDW